MLILICGKDQYRARQKLKELVQKQGPIARDRFLNLFSDKISFEELKNEMSHRSIFQENKLIVLVNALADESFKKNILTYGKEPFQDKSNTIIFFEEKEFSKNEKIFSFFKEQGIVFKFALLPPAELKKWIKKELVSLGIGADLSAINALADFVGNDLWRMSLEIKKLAAYKAEEKKVSKKDVEELVTPQIEVAIFKTIDAIASKDKKTALCLIQEHLKKGDSPFYLLSMIAFQFRNLLMVKEMENKGLPEITAKLKNLHPFVVQKSHKQARQFTFPRLREIYLKIFRIDLAVKTGKIKPELALELLIADI
jgi:DNA polymerase III subunit delta